MINNKGVVSFILCVLLCSCQEYSWKGDRNDAFARDEDKNSGSWDDNLETYKKSWPKNFEIGHAASRSDIYRWDIDVRPDGKGLPVEGSGKAKDGALIYAAKCASCHGQNGYEGPYDKLVTDSTGQNTIGNYWPYATTIFDYVRRAMPFNEPGSLSDQQVYDITAYLLFLNGIIDREQEINYKTLPSVQMPAKERFVSDDRKGGNEIK